MFSGNKTTTIEITMLNQEKPKIVMTNNHQILLKRHYSLYVQHLQTVVCIYEAHNMTYRNQDMSLYNQQTTMHM